MQAACPGCNTIYVLDESKNSAKEATLTCLECGTTWILGRRRRVVAPPSVPKPRRTSTRNEAPAPVPFLPEPVAAAPVTCPRCGHAFAPGASPDPDPARSEHQSREQKGRILLVEDQKYFVELTREVLGESFVTRIVSNLAEAGSFLDKESFDLVILDLSLDDGEDGTKMLRAAKQRGIPVLIFTARDETELYGELWDKLRAAGATDLLIKGINVGEELRKKVSSLLQAKA